MELIQIQTPNDLFDIDNYFFEFEEFEVRMPCHIHQMYLKRNELEEIGQWMKDFIQLTQEQGYVYHKWYDYHLKELIYEFNKEE